MTDDAERQALAAEIRAARKARHMTQSDLAVAAGVSVRTVRNLEAGAHTPQPGNLAAVLAALDFKGDDACGGSDRPAWEESVDAVGEMVKFRLASMDPARRALLVPRILDLLLDPSGRGETHLSPSGNGNGDGNNRH